MGLCEALDGTKMGAGSSGAFVSAPAPPVRLDLGGRRVGDGAAARAVEALPPHCTRLELSGNSLRRCTVAALSRRMSSAEQFRVADLCLDGTPPCSNTVTLLAKHIVFVGGEGTSTVHPGAPCLDDRPSKSRKD